MSGGPRSMKSDRLLSVLLLLQARGRVTERELAERLEVSQRTVHRDMEALSAARVPLSAIRGSQGGWELEKGWRTQVPGLDEGELRALLMGQPRALGHSRLAEAAESALNKLMAALPVPMQAQAAAMRERLHVDPTGWRGTGEDLSMLAAAQEAVAGDRKLAFDYTKADGQTAPRMAEVTVLAGKFERPAQFDLAAYWKQSTAELDEKRASFEVDLCVEAGAARRLAEWGVANSIKSDSSGRVIAPLVKPALPSDEPPAIDQPPDGWVRLTARFDSEELAQYMILGFGARVRVLLPDDFRRRVLAEARKLIGAG